MKWLVLIAFVALAKSEDYDCPAGKSSKTITIREGDSFEFNSNPDGAPDYKNKQKCTVKYKKAKSCNEMKFECQSFNVQSNAQNCKKGDKLFIGKEVFCQTQAVSVTTDKKVLKVRFISNKKKTESGAQCTVSCIDPEPPVTTEAPSEPPSTTEGQPPSPSPSPSPSPTPTPPTNPGGPAEQKTLTISYSWPQEPSGYQRTAKVAIPATDAGQKVPVVFDLHGNGGQGNTFRLGNFLGDDCIIVAPDGYEKSWNVYSEKSKADDVQFVLDLIAKIAAEIPQADMNNVNIAGTSNGAALTYQLLINTGADRPFRRAFPMVSSLIGPQYHDDQFWKFAESAAAGESNDFSVMMEPTFDNNFEYAHFHGTEDGLIQYEGQNPGPALLNNAEVIAAQLTDYIWCKAMGYTGAQIADADGVSVGTTAKPTEEYKYLDGRC